MMLKIVNGICVVLIIQINCRSCHTFNSYLMKLILIAKYENILFLGYFDADVKEANFHLFRNQYILKSLNKNPTCFKNFNNTYYTNLLLIDSGKSFESTCNVGTSLLDFHTPAVTVPKVKGEFLPANVIKYGCWKNFDYATFSKNLCRQTKRLNLNELNFLFGD